MAIPKHPQATREIAEANAEVRLRLPFAETEDFDDARRGRVGALFRPGDSSHQRARRMGRGRNWWRQTRA